MSINNSFDFEELEKKIRRLPEFSSKGGGESLLSFPLFKETGSERFIVHMIYTYSASVPSGFVLTPFSTGEPKVMNISDSLEALDMKDEDFETVAEGDKEPARDIRELNEHTRDAFYMIVSNPDVDLEVYGGYVYSIIPFLEPDARKYYRAFLP